ncbi:MAG TPA: acyl-CoA thioesterase, partial [Deltaproteobacteria bacterium]|nr:acyl-CoA thioesterase [Deltaproteobacteria bacterium]
MRHTYPVRIGWGDCDPAQIVFYPNYFAWFDQ